MLCDLQNPTVGMDMIMRNTVGHKPFKKLLYPSQFQREQNQGKLHVTSKGKAWRQASKGNLLFWRWDFPACVTLHVAFLFLCALNSYVFPFCNRFKPLKYSWSFGQSRMPPLHFAEIGVLTALEHCLNIRKYQWAKTSYQIMSFWETLRITLLTSTLLWVLSCCLL